MLSFLDIMIGPLALADWLSWFCIITGSFFTVIGVIGIIRLPDIFSRMHGAGIVDTLGIMLILTGLMFQADDWIVVIKLLLILLFIFFTSPTTTFALARAAIHGGVTPGPTIDEMPKAQQAVSNTPTEALKQKETDPSKT